MLHYENRVGDFYVSRVQNWEFIPHVHHDLELLVCDSGEFGVCCRNRTTILHPGDVMIAFSHDIHSYNKTGEGSGYLLIFNPQVLPLLSNRLQERQYGNFLTNTGAFYISLAQAIYDEYQSDCAREILVGYLYVLLGTALKALPYASVRTGISADTFSGVMCYLSEHYTEPVSLKSLARTFGVDQCHLSRMFTERLSYGFLKYVHMLRVEHAKNLLRNTSMKISEIAGKSGFLDQKTFNRVFRELVQMTPGAYRRQGDPPRR